MQSQAAVRNWRLKRTWTARNFCSKTATIQASTRPGRTRLPEAYIGLRCRLGLRRFKGPKAAAAFLPALARSFSFFRGHLLPAFLHAPAKAGAMSAAKPMASEQ